VKLYTHVTPSHEVLLDQFLLPSAGEFYVEVRRGPQRSQGVFGCDDWCRSMRDKARAMLAAAEECAGDVFVWADVDVQFFGPVADLLIELLGDYDLACQHEAQPQTLCAGFFVARANPRIRALLQTVADFENGDGRDSSDQAVLNRIKNRVRWTTLPSRHFWTIGHLDKPVRRVIGKLESGWEDLLSQHVPATIYMHHANYIVGIDRKLRVMEAVRRWVALAREEAAGESAPSSQAILDRETKRGF
jgi:hypothetical protein